MNEKLYRTLISKPDAVIHLRKPNLKELGTRQAKSIYINVISSSRFFSCVITNAFFNAKNIAFNVHAHIVCNDKRSIKRDIHIYYIKIKN